MTVHPAVGGVKRIFMAKFKTRKAAAKRFRVRKSGRVFRYRARKKHILQHKSSALKRKLGKMVEVSGADVKKIKQMLGA